MRTCDTTPLVFTIAETAAKLRVHRSTIYRLIHSGDLRAIRVGQSLRIPARELERLLEQVDGSER